MRYIYVSKPGGKPMNIGMNQVKRRAHRLDKQDRAKVVAVLGGGLPKQMARHQELVQARHGHYRDSTLSGGDEHG
jgi:hypothetical protein